MPELGTSGSAGGPGWVTTQVYPTPEGEGTCLIAHPDLSRNERGHLIVFAVAPTTRGARLMRWVTA